MMLLTATSRIDSAAQLLTVLLLFVIVLGATYLTTRYIAGVQKGKLRGTNFEVIDTFQLAQNKYVQILKIGTRYLAVAVCKDSITVLRELEEDEIILPDPNPDGKSVPFEVFLNKAKELAAKNSKKAMKQDDTEEI